MSPLPHICSNPVCPGRPISARGHLYDLLTVQLVLDGDVRGLHSRWGNTATSEGCQLWTWLPGHLDNLMIEEMATTLGAKVSETLWTMEGVQQTLHKLFTDPGDG